VDVLFIKVTIGVTYLLLGVMINFFFLMIK